MAIDLGVLALVGCPFAAAAVLALASVQGWSDLYGPTFLVWLPLCFVYLVGLQPRVGTLGNRLTHIRMVTLKGEPPTALRMTARLAVVLIAWVVMGAAGLFLDFLWAGCEETRQMLRDKVTGIYVVRADAKPAGRRRVQRAYYFVNGFLVVLPEVPGPRRR
jgi:hypothetical protein